MASAPAPTDADIGAFLGRLNKYRSTLSETDQALLDAMVMAAAGQKDEKDQSVKPFWYAYNPPGYGPYNPPGAGYAVGGPYGGYAVGWRGSPWGAAYGVRYW